MSATHQLNYADWSCKITNLCSPPHKPNDKEKRKGENKWFLRWYIPFNSVTMQNWLLTVGQGEYMTAVSRTMAWFPFKSAPVIKCAGCVSVSRTRALSPFKSAPVLKQSQCAGCVYLQAAAESLCSFVHFHIFCVKLATPLNQHPSLC